MTNFDPGAGGPRQNPPTRAYSQTDHQQAQYSQPNYAQPQYQEPRQSPYQAPQQPQSYQAAPPTAAQQPAAAKAPRPSRAPDVDPVKFGGGVLMTGVVTGLAAWLVAWIVRTVAEKMSASDTVNDYLVPPNLPNDEMWFAIVGFVAALLAGALWYVLQIMTPAPDSFYTWIVALLVVAAVVIPLLVASDILTGICTALVHLVIGLPILFLIPTMGHSSMQGQRR